VFVCVTVYSYNGQWYFDQGLTTLVDCPMYASGDDIFLDPECTCKLKLIDMQNSMLLMFAFTVVL